MKALARTRSSVIPGPVQANSFLCFPVLLLMVLECEMQVFETRWRGRSRRLGAAGAKRSAKKLANRIDVVMVSQFHFVAKAAETPHRDVQAVELSITASWNDGPIEGHSYRRPNSSTGSN